MNNWMRTDLKEKIQALEAERDKQKEHLEIIQKCVSQAIHDLSPDSE